MSSSTVVRPQRPVHPARETALPSAWDEYLTWIGFAVPGMLSRGNVDAMAHAIANAPKAGAFVEIGSFCGLSTCVLAHLRERFGAAQPFFTTDAWRFEGQQSGAPLGTSRTVTHDAYRAFVRESFLRNVRTFCANDLPHTIEMESDPFFEAWTKHATARDVFDRSARLGGPIAFAYIDGNHTYPFALRDFRNVDAHLVAGGFILFDDSADGSTWEVRDVIDDVMRLGTYEVVAKVPNYLVRKR